MTRSFTQRLLAPIVDIRASEVRVTLLMFAYAFLAMSAYNIIQPLTRSKLIASLGSRNVPYVLLAASVVIGFLMLGYTRLVSTLPRRWALPIVQAGMATVMIGFWAASSQTGDDWVSVAFYLWGLILGILLISQFWTLANAIYDPRQAKRLFGFIGGGVSLGGATGAALTALLITNLGTNTLMLCSAGVLLLCGALVAYIMSGQQVTIDVAEAGKEEKGVSMGRAFELLRGSRQIKLIAVVIGFGSLGAAIIDQQVNMAAEVFKGPGGEDSIGQFMAQIRVYLSVVGFVIQVWLTPRIHRYLGVGFALLLLPLGLGMSGTLILLLATLWTPAFATIYDRSIRYTVDKTTREVLFLPLPTELRQEIKPFVDVTVDRLSRGFAALLLLVLIQPWGFELRWYQLSFVSLVLAAIWVRMAIVAKREYLASFRRSIERKEVASADVRVDVADLSTIETLIEELASPDEHRVLYAIDILESLDKRNLITPLLLYHESSAVRVRALQALGGVRPDIAQRWLPSIQRMIGDPSPEVRAAAVAAAANIRDEQITQLIRPYLQDKDPRVATTAAVVLARGGSEEDARLAETVLTRLASDSHDTAAGGRRDVAAAIRQLEDPQFRHLLIPLLYDANQEVAEEALRSVAAFGTSDFLFVPTLVSLLRDRRLKSGARDVIVAYGPDVVPVLAHFLRDPDEDLWVRRHIPATIALIPCQASMDALVSALEERDGFLRYKVVTGIGRLRREHPELTFNAEPIEALALREAGRYFTYLTLHHNLFVRGQFGGDSLLAQALTEKIGRTVGRVYLLLGLIYPWKDIAAARWALERGDARARASASEYLDNLMSGPLRKRLMPLLEDLPLEEKIRRGNVLLRTRPRDAEETLLQLINDEDQVVAAAAIDLVEERKVWSLADDIEHVLGHRDVNDWSVFEAASWALAAYRMPESRRRELWIEPLPAVQLAARLRRIPLFASVSVDELFRIAAAGRQVRYEPGRTLYQEGAVPDQVQFLLDGRISVKPKGEEAREVGPPAALGFEQVLEGSAMRDTIRTTETSVCLALSADEVRTLVSDNTELVEGLFRMLSDASFTAGERLVVRGTRADGQEIAGLAAEGLKPIERVLVLERIPIFGDITAAELLTLASIARPIRLAGGEALFREAETPAMYALTAGLVALESEGSDEHVNASAGDVIGAYETLAGIPLGRKGLVVKEGSGLKIEREELFDLLGQRPLLLQQLFSALLKAPTLPSVLTGAR
jgi:AAA family ATP:ADP antiporter